MSLLTSSATVAAAAGCAGIMAIGARFLLTPHPALAGFGVDPDGPRAQRALSAIKGVRDITSGVVPLVVWAVAGREALGWTLVAAALTPAADAVVVLRNGGTTSTALGVHGSTAAVLVAAGLTLALA